MHRLRFFLPGLLMLGLGAARVTSSDYDQAYRPQFHFSPRTHWTNDPNGLVFFQGEYHLFYQYNPFGDVWGHMSWGHAVSSDMLHWKELAVALPEENGVMIFTGSTVIDQHNSSGFCKDNEPCLVAVYTGYTAASGNKKSLQTQNLAYSNDKGRTWTKYSGNPVLDLHMTDFRDPKVFWSEQGKHWVMAVSLPDDHKVRIYGSPDLKGWKTLSEFGPAGATGGQWECPEMFQLPVEGKAGQTRWVMKVGLNPGGRSGGSGEQYFVGGFDGSEFKNDNAAAQTMWTDYGKDCYCGLTFNGLPKEQKQVMIGWMDNWQYAANLPTSPWRGQMTVPRELTLRETPEGLRLVQAPLHSLAKLDGERVSVSGGREADVNAKLAQSAVLKSHSFELKSQMDMGTATDAGWKLLSADGASYTLIGYDKQRGQVYFDRTHSGDVGFSKDFPARVEAPLSLNGPLKLDVVVDRDSVEVFADGGLVTMTDLVFPAAKSGGAVFYSKGGKAGQVSAEVMGLGSVW